jgi:hypothetical protein
VDQPRLESITPVGIGEVPRHRRVRALDHPVPCPDRIARATRSSAALRLPERLAAQLPQLGRVAILQQFAVAGDVVDGRFLLGEGTRANANAAESIRVPMPAIRLIIEVSMNCCWPCDRRAPAA